MRINKTNNNKRVYWIFATIVVLAAIGGILWFSTNHENSDSASVASPIPTTNLQAPSQDEKDAGEQAKSDTVNNTSSNSSKGDDASSVPTSTAINVSITANAQNGSSYQLRLLVGAVVPSGTCTLTMTQGSKTVTKAVPTQSLAQSSTCQGFDIPTSELSTGNWKVAVTVSGSGYSGSATGAVSIQ